MLWCANAFLNDSTICTVSCLNLIFSTCEIAIANLTFEPNAIIEMSSKISQKKLNTSFREAE